MFVACSFRKKRKEKKERTDTNTNAFIPTVHARKQVYLGYSVAWRSRSFAISFLRKRRGTVLAGRGWSFLPSFLPSFLLPSFLPSFLSFEFRSISLAYSSWIYVSFGWSEERNKGRDLNRITVTNITISSSVGAATLHSGWVDLDRTEHRSLLPLPPFPSFVRIDVVVDATASYPGLARPRIDVRTRLTSFHVPHPALVPQIAHLRIVALLRPILSIENSKISRMNLLYFSVE